MKPQYPKICSQTGLFLPIKNDGSQIEWMYFDKEKLLKNYTETDTWTIDRWFTTRGSARIIFKNSNGHERRMTFKHFMETVERGTLQAGSITGTFGFKTFRNRITAYLI